MWRELLSFVSYDLTSAAAISADGEQRTSWLCKPETGIFVLIISDEALCEFFTSWNLNFLH